MWYNPVEEFQNQILIINRPHGRAILAPFVDKRTPTNGRGFHIDDATTRDCGRSGVLKALDFEEKRRLGTDTNDLTGTQAQLSVFVEQRVHILYPHGVYRSVDDQLGRNFNKVLGLTNYYTQLTRYLPISWSLLVLIETAGVS